MRLRRPSSVTGPVARTSPPGDPGGPPDGWGRKRGDGVSARPALARSPGAAGPLLGGEYSWRDDAACASADPELWFPDEHDAAWTARAICARCPVLGPCREDALAHNDQFGIQAGLTVKARQRIRRQRRRAALGEAA